MSESLVIEERDGVAWVTLNRPERLNALSRELIRSLNHYFIELYQRDEIRVVVLRGAGRAFAPAWI